MMRRPLPSDPVPRRPESAFAQVDVCELACLQLLAGAQRSLFDDGQWILTGLAQRHRSIQDWELKWDFTEILNPAWRVVTKEIVLALLAPRFEPVLQCPLAVRAVRSPRTANRARIQLTAWFNWLTSRGIRTLAGVTQELCEQYLEERSWSVPEPDKPQRRLDPDTLSEIVRTMKLVPLYGELLSTDGHRPGFTPWPGKTAAAVVGAKRGRANRVPPVPDHILQPLLATCLYLVNDVGPHLADLLDELRADVAAAEHLPRFTVDHLPAMREVLAQMRSAREPLPAISAQKAAVVEEQADSGPLAYLAANRLGRKIGVRELSRSWAYRRLKENPTLLELAAKVGFVGAWARVAAPIPRADTGELVPWTKPLADGDVEIMAGYVLTACLVLTCALSGMRTSELAEITVGARSCERLAPGTGSRFRLASRVIKWKPFGGVPDEWVVIEEVDRAVALAERLIGRPIGEPLFGTIMIGDRLANLRTWLERSGNRERWGLPLIPQGPVNARMLRRTLAQAIAERPGGLLAAKIALKHISVATTEGYAARPGGSQRLFLAEIEEAEDHHHVRLTVEAFRDFQAGRLPSGPGARGLIEAFAHVDAELKEAARSDPKVLQHDAHLESLLRKQAHTLHVGPANFCWFRDPAKALCLRLAGTPDATKPLVGMCDSARCPQATHHPCHRPVWAGQAESLTVFIESPRVPPGERRRLIPERERALRVVAELDASIQEGTV
ncbi:hypothetical protein ACFXC8_43135 [Streptomyces sp. NPDC059441]|uniref:hypothetical protein n=1 Tax=Streptomyces sp. NPDC059441 TaxID=3346829 RepID=UPI00368EF60E